VDDEPLSEDDFDPDPPSDFFESLFESEDLESEDFESELFSEPFDSPAFVEDLDEDRLSVL
jgi:hypothetical protein